MSQSKANRSKNFSARAFWITILVLASISLGIYFVSMRNNCYGFDCDAVVTILNQPNAQETIERISPDIDRSIEQAYVPVYAAIEEYADFHYSVFGEYIELGESGVNKAGNALAEKLFEGFGDNLFRSANFIDAKFIEEYRETIKVKFQAENSSARRVQLHKPDTEKLLNNVIGRAQPAIAPIDWVALNLAGRGALKIATKEMAKKLVLKISAKAAAKGIIKIGRVASGTATGAIACIWLTPAVAALCSAAGTILAWITVNAVVINIDEFFTREEFENELRLLVDEHKNKTKRMIYNALNERAKQLDSGFSLEELDSIKSSPEASYI